MTTLFFRTETTALPNQRASASDEKQPRVMLLSALAVNKQRVTSGFQFAFIRPDGWTPDKGAIAAHGITAAYCDAVGIRLHAALASFMDYVRSASELVAYGQDFHSFMIDVEISRLGRLADAARRDWRRPGLKRICAMAAAGNLANAGKPMKLRDAHLAIVEEPFGAEDRQDPVEHMRAIARVYFAALDRGFVR